MMVSISLTLLLCQSLKLLSQLFTLVSMQIKASVKLLLLVFSALSVVTLQPTVVFLYPLVLSLLVTLFTVQIVHLVVTLLFKIYIQCIQFGIVG
jgi:hypothetical protein